MRVTDREGSSGATTDQESPRSSSRRKPFQTNRLPRLFLSKTRAMTRRPPAPRVSRPSPVTEASVSLGLSGEAGQRGSGQGSSPVTEARVRCLLGNPAWRGRRVAAHGGRPGAGPLPDPGKGAGKEKTRSSHTHVCPQNVEEKKGSHDCRVPPSLQVRTGPHTLHAAPQTSRPGSVDCTPHWMPRAEHRARVRTRAPSHNGQRRNPGVKPSWFRACLWPLRAYALGKCLKPSVPRPPAL